MSPRAHRRASNHISLYGPQHTWDGTIGSPLDFCVHYAHVAWGTRVSYIWRLKRLFVDIPNYPHKGAGQPKGVILLLPSTTDCLPPLLDLATRRTKNPALMAPAMASSSRSTGLLEAEWKSCIVVQGQLNRLAELGYFPPLDVAFSRSGLAAVDGDSIQDPRPKPEKHERVCFVPFLL